MKKIILISLIVLLVSMPAYSKRMFAEAEYQNYWCSNHNGITEYELKDFTRVDCLTETQAIEFDFANKWAECIGQSLHYGLMTHKQPACVLIEDLFSRFNRLFAAQKA